MNSRIGRMTGSGAGVAVMIGLLFCHSALADANLSNDAIASRVNEALGLGGSDLVSLDIVGLPGEDAVAIVPLGGYLYTITVETHSVRAPGYRVVAQTGPDTWEEVQPGPVMTVLGRVEEVEGSLVVGSWMNGGLALKITLSEDEEYLVEPASVHVPDAPADLHVVYTRGDIQDPVVGHCGNAEVEPEGLDVHSGGGGVETSGGTVFLAELACDTDFEFFQRWGRSRTAIENRINFIINTINNQYNRDVELKHIITFINVRENVDDGYTRNDSTGFLQQFQAQWRDRNDIQRDVFKMFSNRSINGNIIGQAWRIGSICSNSTSYCYSTSNFTSRNDCLTDLAAHELGHLWSAVHCTCQGWTMNPFITCANRFISSNISRISSYRNSRSCLDTEENGTTTLPLFDDFPVTQIDPDRWTGIDGAVVSNRHAGPAPSEPFVLNLDASRGVGDELRSGIMDARGRQNLILEYFYQRTGRGGSPEDGEDLLAEYRNAADEWVELSRQLGAGPDMTTFERVSVVMPQAALHQNLRIRFRTLANASDDDWYIDDVLLAENTDRQPPNPDPMSFSGNPAPVSSTSMTMTSIEAVDDESDVEYLFDYDEGIGGGGHDSDWQSSRTYVDTDQLANLPQSYRVKARDLAGNETAYSDFESASTMIETPALAPLLIAGQGSITVITIETFSWLTFDQSGLFFDSTTDGGDTGINEWIQGTLDIAVGLDPDKLYSFRLKARNRDAVETSYSPEANVATFANVPNPPSLAGAGCDAMRVTIDANGNPAGTVYNILCTDTDPVDGTWDGMYVGADGMPTGSPVWRTAGDWGAMLVQDLTAETTYSFAATARNQDGVETEQGGAASMDTGMCGGGCVRNPAWQCDGDVDGDGQVNPVDSGLVQSVFGSVDGQDLCNYDIDCDGQINPVDAGIVQSLFGTCEAVRAVCP